MPKQDGFQRLLAENKLGDNVDKANKENLDAIIESFKKATTEQDREELFAYILDSTRYDVMEAIVDRKIGNEEDIYNIALRCKKDDLIIGVDTDSVQAKVHKKALDQLDEDRLPQFYSDLVGQLFLNRENKLQLPTRETLEGLYEGLFIAGHREALSKLHDFLGYYRGYGGQSSQELVEALRAKDEARALKLISQGHYVYADVIAGFDLAGYARSEADFKADSRVVKFILLNTIVHPNYNILAINGTQTAMWYAVTTDSVGAVAKILEFAKEDNKLLKFLLTPNNNRAHDPLSWAISGGNHEIMAMLLEAATGNEELLKTLLSPHSRNGKTPLHDAAERGVVGTESLAMVTKILEVANGNNEILKRLFAPDCKGKTPLHIAIYEDSNKVLDIVVKILDAAKGNSEFLKTLFSPDKEGKTPLHWAALWGRLEVIKLLLEHQELDIYAKNKDGKTAIDTASSPERKKLIEDHIKAKTEQARALNTASSVNSSNSSSTFSAMPATTSATQVDTTNAVRASQLKRDGEVSKEPNTSKHR